MQVFQTNLNYYRITQGFLLQINYKTEEHMVIISEPPKSRGNNVRMAGLINKVGF